MGIKTKIYDEENPNCEEHFGEYFFFQMNSNSQVCSLSKNSKQKSDKKKWSEECVAEILKKKKLNF